MAAAEGEAVWAGMVRVEGGECVVVWGVAALPGFVGSDAQGGEEGVEGLVDCALSQRPLGPPVFAFPQKDLFG
ncbi:hypothetical protein CHLRE_09g388023v5 [Chlamydomonas reinhardtii]|uniref:Uncharacterized protein n=1 Tax=Chlamydomonas reinhardtii TaxID=3055 RepID=A0A2K3DDW4_CHLRE|nr:uncharacterized protein CHLRE_09g388023v5 [Chlamydomonas reinhardtii]PNW78725.1 hypothetical protein CHLRE_09g388023v5 [Chlamydomonas reinhardtii]